ncbi:MAG: sulfurtransferase TusA family protein [Nitrososphaerota archaeon]
MMSDEIIVDARYKSCPGPLIMLIRVMRKAEPGKRIKLLSTDPRSPNDVREWASRTGHKFIGFRQVDDYFEICVEPQR